MPETSHLPHSKDRAGRRMDYIHQQRDMRVEEVRHRLNHGPVMTGEEILQLARELFEAGTEAALDAMTIERANDTLSWLAVLEDNPGTRPEEGRPLEAA